MQDVVVLFTTPLSSSNRDRPRAFRVFGAFYSSAKTPGVLMGGKNKKREYIKGYSTHTGEMMPEMPRMPVKRLIRCGSTLAPIRRD
jgi:hypothetical protein